MTNTFTADIWLNDPVNVSFDPSRIKWRLGALGYRDMSEGEVTTFRQPLGRPASL
jgi:hypothetical protein